MHVLKDTTLCAIIRDEMMNPAGGIKDFVESTVPFVERARIVDTGSGDGTRTYLEQVQREYPQLEIIDHVFDGYGDARNVSMVGVHTNWILILDADERIRKSNFSLLEAEREIPGLASLDFPFVEVEEDKNAQAVEGVLSRRFFHRSLHTRFFERFGEWPSSDSPKERSVHGNSKMPIYHFVPNEKARERKRTEWYVKMHFWDSKISPSMRPIDCPSFQEWKKFNPEREKYR